MGQDDGAEGSSTVQYLGNRSCSPTRTARGRRWTEWLTTTPWFYEKQQNAEIEVSISFDVFLAAPATNKRKLSWLCLDGEWCFRRLLLMMTVESETGRGNQLQP